MKLSSKKRKVFTLRDKGTSPRPYQAVVAALERSRVIVLPADRSACAELF
jgi:hypothetical protein